MPHDVAECEPFSPSLFLVRGVNRSARPAVTERAVMFRDGALVLCADIRMIDVTLFYHPKARHNTGRAGFLSSPADGGAAAEVVADEDQRHARPRGGVDACNRKHG